MPRGRGSAELWDPVGGEDRNDALRNRLALEALALRQRVMVNVAALI